MPDARLALTKHRVSLIIKVKFIEVETIKNAFGMGGGSILNTYCRGTELGERVRALQELAMSRPYFILIGELSRFLQISRQNALRMLAASENEEDRILAQQGDFPSSLVSLTTAREWVLKHMPWREAEFKELVVRQGYDRIHYVSLAEAAKAIEVSARNIRDRMMWDKNHTPERLICSQFSCSWLVPADRLPELLIRVLCRAKPKTVSGKRKTGRKPRMLPPYGYTWVSDVCARFRMLRATLNKLMSTLPPEMEGQPVMKRKGNRWAVLTTAAAKEIRYWRKVSPQRGRKKEMEQK